MNYKEMEPNEELLALYSQMCRDYDLAITEKDEMDIQRKLDAIRGHLVQKYGLLFRWWSDREEWVFVAYSDRARIARKQHVDSRNKD